MLWKKDEMDEQEYDHKNYHQSLKQKWTTLGLIDQIGQERQKTQIIIYIVGQKNQP